MMRATEARANVINYEVAIQFEIKNKVKEYASIMSQSIEYHSKSGFSSATFYPYEKSRFNSTQAIEYAHELIQDMLTDAGYTILENNTETNCLRIEW